MIRQTFQFAMLAARMALPCVLLCAASLTHAADDQQQWGTLKGQFVIEGKTPAMAKIDPNKDVAVCGKHPLQSETLVVDKNGALANVLIYALGNVADFKAPIAKVHPSYDKLKGSTYTLENKHCRFEPRLAVVWTEQKFVVKNSDPSIEHNSYGQPFANPQFNPIIPEGRTTELSLKNPEMVPFPMTCSIHPWMKGYVISRPDPYAAASKATGEFTIENLPVGELTFRLWQESLGYLSKVKLNGKDSADRKGLYKLTIKPGDNDLGKIVLNAKDYEDKLNKLK